MLLSKKTNKIVIASMLMLCMGIQSMDASARIGGGSRSSSYSSNRSYSSGNSYSSPSRAGSGGNAGMQRNDVVNRERQASAAPSNQANSQPINQAAPQAAPSKFGLGTVAGAALAGAGVGYLLNSHGNNNQGMQNNGGNGQYANGQNDGFNGAQNTNQGFPWGTLLMLLLLGYGLYWLYKRSTGLKAMGANMKEALNPAANANYQANPSISANNQAFESDALQFFGALQEANNRGDVAFMQKYSVGAMQDILVDDIKNRNQASNSQFNQINAKVIDMTNAGNQSIASVRFTGMVGEANGLFEPMDEVWHLTRESGDWQLAGIEQI